jgi:hypothetical protein
LLETKYTLEHTLSIHDLILSAKLEIRIQQLEEYKVTYCTVEERKAAVVFAQAALDDAMERKEFKKCSQLQQDLATCDLDLKEAIKAGAYSTRLPIGNLVRVRLRVRVRARVRISNL